MNAQPRIAYISTYPPRACGIATFTRDLTRAMLIRGQTDRDVVVPVDDNGTRYPANIAHTIDQHSRRSYLSAASFLNESDIELVSLQHEFGIFGGESGEYVLDLCRNIDKPLVTTFHTVLRNPSEKIREIVREISQISQTVVVTIAAAANILEKHFGVNPDKIVVIRHGVAVPDCVRKEYAKRQLGISKRTVLATHGLIGSGKGIEFAIKALPYLVKKTPDILYLVIGETHPEVRKNEGEAYRNTLISEAKRLGVSRNVRFVNRYLREDELSLYLQATDIYAAPYRGRDQVSSGTITLALAYGKAIVATPTIFAREILSHKRGMLCKFDDARSIANCVKRILHVSGLRQELETNASKYGQEVGWAKVADQYGDVYKSAICMHKTMTREILVKPEQPFRVSRPLT
jgi:glycosyltransferase involved in cell wall biosynthesis